MDLIGKDCENIIKGYVMELKQSDLHKKLIKEIKNMKKLYLYLEGDEYKIIKIKNKFFIQFIIVLDKKSYLVSEMFTNLLHFDMKKEFLYRYNLKKIWNVQKKSTFYIYFSESLGKKFKTIDLNNPDIYNYVESNFINIPINKLKLTPNGLKKID